MYRLLLVDDEEKITEGLVYLLDWERYQITSILTANTYEEALKIGMDTVIHIAIIDVCIEDRKGYHLYQDLLRFQPKLQCIMISGYDEFIFVREALRCGVEDYLLKPVDRIELGKNIEKIVVNHLHGTIKREYQDKTKYDEILNKEYSEMNKLVRKIITIVQRDYDKGLNLSVLSEMLEMNSSYLGQI